MANFAPMTLVFYNRPCTCTYIMCPQFPLQT